MCTLNKLEEALDELRITDGGKDFTIIDETVLTNKELVELVSKMSGVLSELAYHASKKVGE
ncbi:MAG TPA: hypothetical protein DCL21_07345 [Alphaproteobacteria bacterium]|nr:hypothetical protein [Alphaproteobacteria bacterium]